MLTGQANGLSRRLSPGGPFRHNVRLSRIRARRVRQEAKRLRSVDPASAQHDLAVVQHKSLARCDRDLRLVEDDLNARVAQRTCCAGSGDDDGGFGR